MKININKIGQTSFEWWCKKKGITAEDRHRMSFSNIKQYTTQLLDELNICIDNMRSNNDIRARQEATVETIRISHALAWLNSIDINNWIQLNVSQK